MIKQKESFGIMRLIVENYFGYEFVVCVLIQGALYKPLSEEFFFYDSSVGDWYLRFCDW